MGDAAKRTVLVIGAGAAGLTAAIFASRAGARVLLIERTADGGRKILISGGGRCNVLPSQLSPSQYETASSPNTLKKMLLSWPLREQRRFFEEELGIELAEEPETGKLFPSGNRAREVRDRLREHAAELGVESVFGTTVSAVLPPEGTRRWTLRLDGGPALEGDAVVLATGGLSVPQTGSDGTGLRIARELGHTLNPTYPALTPLTADPHPHADLAGISLSVRIAAPLPRGEWSTRGGFLVTHRGYSGPTVLNVSHLAIQARAAGTTQPIHVAWAELTPQHWEERLLDRSAGTVTAVVRRELPQRLADRLVTDAGVPLDRSVAQLRREERRSLIEMLTAFPLPWTGDEGYRKAEVTGGGVTLGEVEPSRMESRVRPGLHLCGEILDAFGPIGGYNFAWAWATGRAAGLGAARPPEEG